MKLIPKSVLSRPTCTCIMYLLYIWFIITFSVVGIIYRPARSAATPLTYDNIDTVLEANDFVLINFYTTWCRFSNALAPIYDEAADMIKAQFPDTGKVFLGKVDCEEEVVIATYFRISKFPTMKIIRHGQFSKKEYRGQRSVKGIVEFLRKEMEDPIIEIKELHEIDNHNRTKRNVVGVFSQRNQTELQVFRKVAANLKDDCQFYARFNDSPRTMPSSGPFILFKPEVDTDLLEPDEPFIGNSLILDELRNWAEEKCIPAVREITFDNAEELAEEGLPFMVLFHKAGDIKTIKDYKRIIKTDLAAERQRVNFLTADATDFSHPLTHLDKTLNDLPFIALDSFTHMYSFPDYKDMFVPGKLKKFIDDMFSGKLHLEFHSGDFKIDSFQFEILGSKEVVPPQSPSPPLSTFKNLAPSKHRYSLIERDEL